MAMAIPWRSSLARDGSTMVHRTGGNLSVKIRSTWESTCSCGEGEKNRLNFIKSLLL